MTTQEEQGDETPLADLVSEWETADAEMRAAKDREMKLRLAIFARAFPSPREGTNTQDLPELGDKVKLKAKHGFNYKIDKAALPAVLEQLPEGTEDTLVRYTPELSLSAYRSLAQEHRAIFDAALTITPATPQMEVSRPTPKKVRK